MENILTLGKLLHLWFCFLLHSILFFISQTSYHTYKIISSYELARPIMGTIFLVYNIYIRDSQLNRPESVSLASLARQLPIHIPQRDIVIFSRDIVIFFVGMRVA